MDASTIAMQRMPGRDAPTLVDFALPTSLALRETVHRSSVTNWSQAAKDRLYARMFPDQGGSFDDVSVAHA